jgi:hypothetical protein
MDTVQSPEFKAKIDAEIDRVYKALGSGSIREVYMDIDVTKLCSMGMKGTRCQDFSDNMRDIKITNTEGVYLRYCPWCGEKLMITVKEPKFKW